MKPKIFIDGGEGTTGLKILSRLQKRNDIELLAISPDLRKDPLERAKISNASDVVFLCLPDIAAKESADGIINAKIIDASTAHRTAVDWTYGFPELSKKHRYDVIHSQKIAVPGCHATGFTAAVFPLVKSGIIPKKYPITCHSVTGYSGGGKQMIAAYQDLKRPESYNTPRQYSLTQNHKHLPEMKYVCELEFQPVFNPIVCDYYSGLTTTIPLHNHLLNKKPSANDIWELLSLYYENEPLINVLPFGGEGVFSDGTVDAGALANLDSMEIIVCGNKNHTSIICRLDNLGKGASGAAIQCLNLCCGFDETLGLQLNTEELT